MHGVVFSGHLGRSLARPEGVGHGNEDMETEQADSKVEADAGFEVHFKEQVVFLEGIHVVPEVSLEELGSFIGIIEGGYSILVASSFMWSGVLDSSGVLLSYPSHNITCIAYNQYTDISSFINLHVYHHAPRRG